MIFRRGRFHDLVHRQLDLFESETALLDEAAEADAAWSSASAGDSEELYGDYQLVVDAIADRLIEIRETYAAALAEPEAHQYRAAFDREAARRFRRHPTISADLVDDPG